MKITRVEPIHLRLPDVNERCDGSQETLVVKAHTDEGIVGVGEVDSSSLVAKAIIEAPLSHKICRGLAECVLGQDPFGPALDATVAGETIDRAHVVAKRISRPQDAAHCRILFISSSEDGQLKEILAELEGASVLTVSDAPQFARRGGMVQFILDGNKVRFEVNLPAAERVGLNLSSELLKLAVNVRRSP